MIAPLAMEGAAAMDISPQLRENANDGNYVSASDYFELSRTLEAIEQRRDMLQTCKEDAEFRFNAYLDANIPTCRPSTSSLLCWPWWMPL
jgi:hypothetical protein